MNGNTIKFDSYEIVDLVLNDDFKQLVLEKKDLDLRTFLNVPFQYGQNIERASNIILGIQTKSHSQSLDKKYKVWMQIRKNYQKERKLYFFRYAAILILMFSIGTGTLLYLKEPSTISEFAQSNSVSFEQAHIVMSTGSDIPLAGNNPQVKSVENGNAIILNDSIRYKQNHKGFNQMIVSYGERATLILADGTLVRMNSGSRLIYPPQFNGNEREVYLEGEAYFEVTKNKEKPFYVRTDEYNVEVLGTTFNAQAYEKENLYSTVLIEGQIKLTLNNHPFSKAVVLKPNQIASLTGDLRNIEQKEIKDIETHISWLDGYLSLNDESLSTLIKRISSYYGVVIQIDGKRSQKRINGKLDLKNDPERIISGLAEISQMRYRKITDKIFVMY